MQLVTARTVAAFARAHPQARQALADWKAVVEGASWGDPDSLRRSLGASARPIGNNRVIFEIKGDDFRLVAEIRYASPDQGQNGIVYVQFIGTHAEYDRIDALTVTRAAPRSRP